MCLRRASCELFLEFFFELKLGQHIEKWTFVWLFDKSIAVPLLLAQHILQTEYFSYKVKVNVLKGLLYMETFVCANQAVSSLEHRRKDNLGFAIWMLSILFRSATLCHNDMPNFTWAKWVALKLSLLSPGKKHGEIHSTENEILEFSFLTFTECDCKISKLAFLSACWRKMKKSYCHVCCQPLIQVKLPRIKGICGCFKRWLLCFNVTCNVHHTCFNAAFKSFHGLLSVDNIVPASLCPFKMSQNTQVVWFSWKYGWTCVWKKTCCLHKTKPQFGAFQV